jgi:hypothetical protein
MLTPVMADYERQPYNRLGASEWRGEPLHDRQDVMVRRIARRGTSLLNAAIVGGPVAREEIWQ